MRPGGKFPLSPAPLPEERGTWGPLDSVSRETGGTPGSAAAEWAGGGAAGQEEEKVQHQHSWFHFLQSLLLAAVANHSPFHSIWRYKLRALGYKPRNDLRFTKLIGDGLMD